MKLFILILALTLYQSTAQVVVGGYTEVDPSEVDSNQNIQDILKFGAHYVVEQAIKAQALPDTDYDVVGVYSVYSQVVSGMNYQFDVEISNNQGTTLRAAYIVYDQPWTNTRKVTSYVYNINDADDNGELDNLEFLPEEAYLSEEDHIIVGGYTEMDLEAAKNDPEVQDLLSYGVQYLTQQEVLGQKLPEAQYTVSQLRSVWTQVVSGINYRFDCDISNNLGWVLRATFVVYNQAWTDTKEVSSYVYAVTTNPNPSEEEEFVIPNEEDIAGGYEPVDPSAVDTDEEVRFCLDEGVQDVVRQAVIDHALPDSTYEVSKVHTIYSQVVSGVNYRFDVDLINCAGLVARTVFTVYYQSWTNTLETTPGSLHVTSIPDEGLIGGNCPNEGSGEEECIIDEESGEGSIPGGWTPVDLDEVDNDAQIQDLLHFGAEYVANQGIQNHRLPDSTYDITKIFGVQSQVVAGANYKFDVELTNCKGLTVRANYVVYYVPWMEDDTREVTEYSFDITSAPNGFFIGDCPNDISEEETIITPEEEENNEEEPLAGGWSAVDPQDAEGNTDLEGARDFGIQQLTQTAIQNKELPNETYQFNGYNSIESQVVSGTNYRFDVNLLGNAGTSARVSFEVYSQPWTNTLKLISYSVLSLLPGSFPPA